MQESREILIKDLKAQAKEIRKMVLWLALKAGSGHVPSSFSSADIITALYFHSMRYDASNPLWEDRDRLILSAGHKGILQYSALYYKGVITKDRLATIEAFESTLPAHPYYGKCPGVEASTGSLGHGFPIAGGMALAAKIDQKPYRVFALLGDGECHEGSIWEAAMSASKYKLDNLVAIIDHNKMNSTYPIDDSMPLPNFRQKWESFGFAVREVDGHDMGQLIDVLSQIPFELGKPNAIIAHTIKGCGCDFITNKMKWHAGAWNQENYERALAQVEAMD